MITRLLLFLSLLFAPLAVAEDDSVVEEILDRGSIRVGFSSFVPWAMRDKEGNFIGFEIDVARAVAEDMGVELELVPTSWDGIIPALLAKKFDIIIGGMTITPTRNLQVNFTDVYDESGLDIVAHRELAAGFSTLEDFNRPDVTFAMRRGASPVEYVKKYLPKAKILQFDDEASARRELINGNAHAHVGASPSPMFLSLDYSDTLFRPLDELLQVDGQGMALRKGDADALNFFNNWIRVRHKSGWLSERHNYWFGSRDWKDRLAE